MSATAPPIDDDLPRGAARGAPRGAARDERVFLMGEDVGALRRLLRRQQGLLEEFGPERVRDTPLSESAFVGAGIGAALGGMRPIVEIMTVNFSLLALDQIVNNAATLLHMSGGQFNVPLVIRMTTGAGRQLAAQHSHSLEGWYAHIPGHAGRWPRRRSRTPAACSGPRSHDPDPVLIFEHGIALQHRGRAAPTTPAAVDIDRARGPPRRRRRHADHLRRHAGQGARGGRRARRARASRPRSSTCARCGRSTTTTHLASVAQDPPGAWSSTRAGAAAASPPRSARASSSRRFYELDAPVERVCSAEVPIPYAKHLEEAALPQVARRSSAARAAAVGADAMAEFRMPSLGADMEAARSLEWRVEARRQVHRGDIVAVVDTEKSAIEVEIFDDGVVGELLVEPGTTSRSARRWPGSATPAEVGGATS